MTVANIFYDNEMGVQTIDVSAATRKFQNSIIVKQDPEKSGFLSFLKQVEEERESLPTRSSTPTMTPTSAGSTGQEGY